MHDSQNTSQAQRPGPLSGIVVLDVTRVVAGPYCTMMLADLGARVIKIENPSDPDYVRDFPPFVDAAQGRQSGFFAQYNRHKEGVTLDLKQPAAREVFLQMVRKADVVVENFRPGVMARLGLGYDVLREVNPRLIYTGISGFGQVGPNSSLPAYDNSAQAAGGLWSINGPVGEPTRVGTIIGDLAASLYAVIGTLAALREVERTGEGQMVDVSQQDAVMSLTENAVVNYTCKGDIPGPLGNDHPFVRPYGRFPCQDGHVFFGGYTDKFWREACLAFGEPELLDHPDLKTMEQRFDADTYEAHVRPAVERWFATRTKAELEVIAGDRFPLSPIKNIAEVVTDPHILARGMMTQALLGGAQFEVFGSPIKLSATPAQVAGAAPTLGQHTDAVLRDWLGLSDEALDGLRQEGVI
ncbi:formyl-CoA transferase [Alcanivorax sp. S71-1-4]|uniref:CaiB/BaiF CoA transferase family protein n=1 Tax=Alcanivorax sp. S71-1-4 TaxID=1177159 RepID=UPI00135713E6|nr:CoA transferase [Alcanivorax sp. S71-1-4]KAF0811069.1 formyl-CoA transferase [Alcanivorax sp. S71-1-4]